MLKSYRPVKETTAIQGAATAISDIIISATFIYLFRSQRSGHARWPAYRLVYYRLDFVNRGALFSKTDTLLNKMIKYAVNRAVVTSFCAVAGVMLVIPYIVIMELIINKVYGGLVLLLLRDILLASCSICRSHNP